MKRRLKLEWFDLSNLNGHKSKYGNTTKPVKKCFNYGVFFFFEFLLKKYL